MKVFLALHQNIYDGGYTDAIGVFTSKDKARKACEKDADHSLAWGELMVRNDYRVYEVELDEILKF